MRAPLSVCASQFFCNEMFFQVQWCWKGSVFICIQGRKMRSDHQESLGMFVVHLWSDHSGDIREKLFLWQFSKLLNSKKFFIHMANTIHRVKLWLLTDLSGSYQGQIMIQLLSRWDSQTLRLLYDAVRRKVDEINFSSVWMSWCKTEGETNRYSDTSALGIYTTVVCCNIEQCIGHLLQQHYGLRFVRISVNLCSITLP